jgi:hypothetical protein
MITLPKRHTSSPLGHSADVSLWLHVADQKISLAQTSNTAVKLDQDIEVSPGPARVEIINDGVSHISVVTITGRKPNSLWLNYE